MEADIYNISDFVKVNNLKEVTNPILLERDNIPTDDGLLSYSIFGRNITDRMNTWAYIDLHGHFLEPLVYITWKRLDRKIEGVVAGITHVRVENGTLVADDNGWTGLEELYKHFDEIKFPDKQSLQQQTRSTSIGLLKKDEAFWTKMPVMPAFYRDLQTSKSGDGKVSTHEITDAYGKILRLTKAIDNDISGLVLVGNSTRNRIQDLIVHFYKQLCMERISHKDGLFRRDVMGKSVDYGARLVISAPQFNKQTSNQMTESFEYCGMPLAATCATFFPFIINWLQNYFNNEIIAMKNRYPILDKKTGKIRYIRLKNVEQYNDDYFTKKISSFIKAPGSRFDKVTIETEDNLQPTINLLMVGTHGDEHNINGDTTNTVKRPLTWTDLLFRAAVDSTKNRHALITRYPLNDYFGMFPIKINPIATTKSTTMLINGVEYKNYPIIDLDTPKIKIGSLFRDSLSISNLYLEGLGGDYDGDQVTVRGVWSDEGNKECDEFIYSVRNILDINGEIVRLTTKEALQTLYNLS